MRNLLLFSLIIAGVTTLAGQQAPPPAAPAPAAPAPAAQAPAKPRATSTARTAPPAAAARGGIALTVTNMQGATLSGVQVELTGPTPRRGETSSSGQVNFPSLQAGTYRLRFSGDAVTSFEREITVAASKPTTLDVVLNPAPPVREVVREIAPAAPPPAPLVVGPKGEPHLTSLYDIAEKELRAKQPRREILVACSGNTRSMVVILNNKDQTQPQRIYEGAEVAYYVLGGEATIRVGDQEMPLAAGGYATVPRGVSFTIARRGSKPLSLLSILSGEPCEEAR